MKTLFERLKPEIKQKLLSEQSEFPMMIGELIEILKGNVAITEMKLGDLNNLTSFAPSFILSINELYDMFEK